MVISVEAIKAKYKPKGTNLASDRQKAFLENLVESDSGLRNRHAYSSYWTLMDITDITAKDAWLLCDFFQNTNSSGSLIHDLYLQYPSGEIDTDKFTHDGSADAFNKYFEDGTLPLMFHYLKRDQWIR